MNRKRSWLSLRSVAAVGLAATLPFAAAAAQQPQTQKPTGTVGKTGAVTAATVEKIVDNPEYYYGETVRVTGPVGRVFGARVFNIEEEGVVDVDDALLVLAPKNSPKLTDDAMVEVRGTVRRLVTAELEREYGATYWDYWGVDRDFFVTYDKRPVIFADAIDIRR